MPRLRLITGFALDARAISVMGFPETEVEAWEFLPPRPGESLPAYALRMGEAMNHRPEDALGGISFGGMLALEIARQKGARKLVLMSTITHPRGLRAPFRRLISLLPFVPDAALQAVFGALPTALGIAGLADAEQKKLLADILSRQSASWLRAFPLMIADWRGCRPTCPYAWLQSRRDWLFKPPLHLPGVDYWEGRHHLLTVPFPERTRAWVERALLPEAAQDPGPPR